MSRILPWLLFGTIAALETTGYWLLLRNVPPNALEQLILVVIFLLYGAMGAFVASRRPRNPIGWMLMAVAGFPTLAFFSEQYAQYGLVTEPGSLPAADLVAWPSFWMWGPGVALLFTFLPLLFPTGRFPSPRWRPLGWFTGSIIVVLSLVLAFAPTPNGPIRNPLGISLQLPDIVGQLVEALEGPVLLTMLIAPLASVVVRFRHGSPVERQQLKWFLFAIALFAVLQALEGLGSANPVVTAITEIGRWVAVALLPIAVGIAILRHRLYDIDLLIKHTVVYGGLTALLAAVYFGGVLLLSQVLGDLAQGDQLAVAGSTLAVAALFGPFRSHLQATVDRRFYRARYDTQRTLEAFTARIRDEVDLDTLTDVLRGAVQQTMQPTSTTVWLRVKEPGR